MKTVFIRTIEADVADKATVLRKAIRSPESSATTRYDLKPSLFLNIESAPFAYWISDALLQIFQEPRRLRDHAETRCGMSTLDDFRFVRLRTERNLWARGPWVPYVKGNTYRPFFDSLETCVNWGANGEELKVYVEQKVGSASRKIQAEQFYFHPGVTWVRRTHRLCVRVMPQGCIFTGGAQAAFDPEFDQRATLRLLGLLSSSVFDALTKVSVGRTGDAVQFESGMLDRVPLPNSSTLTGDLDALAPLVRRAWWLQRALDARTETSHAFTLPALLQVDGHTLSERARSWLLHVAKIEAELVDLQTEIDDRCFALYGIEDPERTRIGQGFSREGDDVEKDEDDDSHDGEEEDAEVDVGPMVASLLSWAVGVAFGHFDVRIATGARAEPRELEPFDPLPVCSPGMLTDDNGFPPAGLPQGYPLRLPLDGVLVDDRGHALDLTGRVGAVFEVLFGEQASERLIEAENALGRRNEDLRTWFAKRFFASHIKRYSRSRRKAPIYWQLGTPSASYSVWCYCHRLDGDTFFRLSELIQHKVDHEEGKLNTLRQESGADPSSKQRRVIDAQESFVGELRTFKDEVERVAPLWKPHLDDGIIIHFALLWRLVPHDKSWQRQCKKIWDELQKGDYDWAHLAMHLWPERVVPKCAKDRSLAIAHGLESEFWLEDDDGKWERRKVNSTRVGELVAERSSSAVKAALGALVSAPVQGGAKRRGRKRGSA